MKTKTSQDIQTIQELRLIGKSINEISEELCISKATALKYCRGIALQRPRRCHTHTWKSLSNKKRAGIIRKLKKWSREHRAAVVKNIAKAKLASDAAFTDKERQLLPQLELTYGRLRKEKVGNNWADFVNDKVVIEVTEDWGKGTSEAIARFENRQTDFRRKIVYCPFKWFGQTRRERAKSLGIEVFDINTIRGLA